MRCLVDSWDYNTTARHQGNEQHKTQLAGRPAGTGRNKVLLMADRHSVKTPHGPVLFLEQQRRVCNTLENKWKNFSAGQTWPVVSGYPLVNTEGLKKESFFKLAFKTSKTHSHQEVRIRFKFVLLENTPHSITRDTSIQVVVLPRDRRADGTTQILLESFQLTPATGTASITHSSPLVP